LYSFVIEAPGIYENIVATPPEKISATGIAKYKSCYHKCLKQFFGYLKYSSVTNMSFELGFDTLLHNYKVSFYVSGYL